MAHASRKLFFKDKPLFGLDIGHDSLRVIQLDLSTAVPKVKGYGTVAFDQSAFVDGVIVKPELIAKAALTLFRKELIGDISTNHVAVSLPTARALTRAVHLPKMNRKDVDDAIQTEAEQFISTGTENLYIDYNILKEDEEGIEVFVVAMPKRIVDSYLVLMRILGLEAVLLDTSIVAGAKIFAHDKQSDIPSVLIDFGAQSTDITVFNKGLVVTGTVAFGGDNVTDTIAKTLHIDPREATVLKSKFGLSKSDVQNQIVTAIQPSLEVLLKEIRRTIRYYEQRYSKELPIGQVVTMGGGANTPGLADYLTEQLRLPVRAFNPVNHLDFGHLHPFYMADRMSYVTAVGLAMTNPAEVFA